MQLERGRGLALLSLLEMDGRKVDTRSGNIQRNQESKVDSPLLRVKVSPNPSDSPSNSQGITVYKWRWVVLAAFFLNNAVTNYIWIMSAIIADLIVCYYGITDTLLNFTTTSYMIVYIVFILPVTWFMDRYGLRLPVVLASAMMALGAAIRVIGTGSQSYWIILLGQFVAATSDLVFFSGSPQLSETWFPSSERATATAIGAAIAPQVGILIALGVTPVVIHSPLTERVCNTSNTSLTGSPEEVQSWSDEVYYRWLYYQCAVAGVAILTFLLTVCTFYDAPPTPPSLSRQLEKNRRENEEEEEDNNVYQKLANYLASLLLYFKNGYFVLFLITSGIFLATAGAIVSFINEIVNPYFPGKDEQIGYLGVVAQCAAVVSMLMIGRILDWAQSYYVMNVMLSLLGTLSVVALVVLIQYQHHFYFLYIAVAFVGVTLTSYQALAYEYAVEMTYPLPEVITTGLVNVVSQVVSIAMILLVTPKWKVFAMWFVAGTTAFGAALTVFTRPKLKRVEIDEKH